MSKKSTRTPVARLISLRPGDVVRPIGDDLRNAVFEVVRVERGGWVKCHCVMYADGSRPSRMFPRHGFSFRVGRLAKVDDKPSDGGETK